MSRLEKLVLVHLGLYLVATTWLFGGNADFIRPYLAGWGSIGIALTCAAGYRGRTEGGRLRLWRLWPFGLFNLLVFVTALTPGFQRIRFHEGDFYSPVNLPWWRPSAAIPARVWSSLWLFDAIYLSAFNLFLFVRRRRTLRLLLVLAVVNTLALSLFGTVQKLLHAPGLFFGLVRSPQPYFFSSFIYRNHWGAFVVLMAAAGLGLAERELRRGRNGDFSHSPALAGLAALLIFAVTVPLSGSRACTGLLTLLFAWALARGVLRLIRRRRALGESAAPPLLGLGLFVAAAVAAIWFVGQDTIADRLATTKEQVAQMRAEGSIGSRAVVYHDTWRMAEDRILFGWGMASYPFVFPIYDTQDHPNSIDHLPVYHLQADSDWLQAVAEHGLAGALLLGLCALVPLWGADRRRLARPLPLCLLAGCALVLLYAWVEFPFGNTAVVLSWWLCFFCALRYAGLGPGQEKSGAKGDGATGP